MKEIANWTVTPAMHEAFAELSGDVNPIHMDAVAARRTQAGEPVVHGVHTLLRAMQEAIVRQPSELSLVGVKSSFLRWVYVGEEAVLSETAGNSPNSQKLQITVNDLVVLTADLTYAASSQQEQPVEAKSPSPLTHPRPLSFSQMAEHKGTAYVVPASAAAGAFPALAKRIGAICVAEMAACSYVVGMEVPGLYSMFSKVSLQLQPMAPRAGLDFDVSYADERFRKLRIHVVGTTLEGSLEVFARVPPVAQASIAEVARSIKSGEFSGVHALVIGGSRGLGEMAAKIVAAGAGEVTITYALGQADAEAVTQEIASWGGKASAIQYDVRKPAAPQLSALSSAPTHLFYFATSTIFRPKKDIYSVGRFADFIPFYLQGFYDLCVALTKPSPQSPRVEALQVFYPSTVFIESRPAGMAEYAMVKAAGEVLCEEMNRYLPALHIEVARLPKLQTDQTAGVVPDQEVDALGALLPILRKLVPAPPPATS